MLVNLNNISSLNIPRQDRLESLAKKVILGESNQNNFNIIFCDDSYMRELNYTFRQLDKTTDVLAFTYSEDDIWGEVYISAEKAKRQAPKWDNTFYKELKRLTVHGLLHILGYDHKNKKDKVEMLQKENLYLIS